MTKKIIPLLMLLAALAFSGCSKHDFSEKFSYEPSKPIQASNVTVLYNAKGTPLDDAEKIYAVAYNFNDELLLVDEYEMKREGEGWTVEFKTAADAEGILLKFTDGDEITDNNDKNGYLIELYQGDGSKFPGIKAGLAAAYAGWIRSLNIDPDREKAFKMFNDAFAQDSSIVREYIISYVRLSARTGDNPLMQIKTALEYLEKFDNLNENELALLAEWFGKMPEDKKAEKYKNLSLEKYPKGIVAQKELFNKFKKSDDIDEQLNLIHEFKSNFENDRYLEGMTFDVLRKCLNEKKFDLALMIIQHGGEDLHPYYFGYAVSKMMDAGYDRDKIKNVLELGIKKAQGEVSKPDSEKPETVSLREWRQENSYYLGTIYNEYAKLMIEEGDKSAALEAYKNAVEMTKDFYSNPETNEGYASILVELGKEAEAIPFIEELVKNGEASAKLKELLKTSYIKTKGGEEGYDNYLARLQGVANAELIKKLKKEKIEEDAPDFTLNDLDGQSVTLSSLKGKTVIVDFWATWCGPCKKSFPGMKKIVEKFSGDDNVKFLFVNTWESVPNKKENAKKFITENNYPFRVLLDTENEIVGKFKVQGIPTKFIIDKNGKIRFKSVGFAGTDDALVDELSAMIAMIQ